MNTRESGPYVCIVDDDADLREALKLVLELRGHKTVEAEDGTQALEILKQRTTCCVILLDLMMPRMNGWQFRSAQRLDPQIASIPVIVLSAVPDAPRHARDVGATAYLFKPIDIERLLEEVGRYCPKCEHAR